MSGGRRLAASKKAKSFAGSVRTYQSAFLSALGFVRCLFFLLLRFGETAHFFRVAFSADYDGLRRCGSDAGLTFLRARFTGLPV